MTGGKSPGGGSGKSAFPGHRAAGGRFQKREVLRGGSVSCGRGSQGIRTGMANRRAVALNQEGAR